MVLNQRQVLVIVSDWEPYLGSLFGVGFLWVIVPVSVFAPDRAVLVSHISCFVSLFMYSFFIKKT